MRRALVGGDVVADILGDDLVAQQRQGRRGREHKVGHVVSRSNNWCLRGWSSRHGGMIWWPGDTRGMDATGVDKRVSLIHIPVVDRVVPRVVIVDSRAPSRGGRVATWWTAE